VVEEEVFNHQVQTMDQVEQVVAGAEYILPTPHQWMQKLIQVAVEVETTEDRQMQVVQVVLE
tara:strand:+ start:527 stop:712 length:186 start_codon:yes stop_codon:yes gene_type:complete